MMHRIFSYSLVAALVLLCFGLFAQQQNALSAKQSGELAQKAYALEEKATLKAWVFAGGPVWPEAAKGRVFFCRRTTSSTGCAPSASRHCALPGKWRSPT